MYGLIGKHVNGWKSSGKSFRKTVPKLRLKDVETIYGSRTMNKKV